MNCDEHYFGCHRVYDIDDHITSSRNSPSLNALIENLDAKESDMYTIQITQ